MTEPLFQIRITEPMRVAVTEDETVALVMRTGHGRYVPFAFGSCGALTLEPDAGHEWILDALAEMRGGAVRDGMR